MKKKLLLLMMVMLGIAAGVQAADVEINATNFPDTNFRNLILAQDYGADGILTDEEIASVIHLSLTRTLISDLKGIEFFTALRALECAETLLTALDVSKNTALETLYCSCNQLTDLDVSKNTALKELYCDRTQLTTLDVSKNTALKELDCSVIQLTALDVSKNTALESLYCSDNQLTDLDVSKNTALKNLECYSNQLTDLDVSKNTALTWLGCGGNKLTALDVSKNTALTWLSCGGNKLTALDVSKNTAMTWLGCWGNKLTALDVSKNTALEGLNCSDNQLTVLDVSKNAPLTYLECFGNKIRGEAMQKLVNSLYDWSTHPLISGSMYVYKYELPTGNEMTTQEVAVAKANDWHPWKYKNVMEIVEYPGVTPTVTLNKSEVIVKKNKSVTLTATLYPETLEDKSVTWKSWDKTIATVSSSGKVTGVKSGVVTITCTSNATGLCTTCEVTVGTITLNKKEVVVKKKSSVTLKPTVYPSTLEDKSVKWESSDKTIATVSSSGKVKGIKSGVVTITCTSNATGLSASCKVTVATIALNKSEVIVRKKKSVTLKPTVYPTTLEDKSVTWKSSDESVATVSSDGVVTGIKSGIITITCTSNATGLSTTCKVTVATIALNKSSATITLGKTLTLKPTVYPTTMEDQSVTWKSSNTKVATVKNGKVTGVKAGTATITCTSNATGLSTTCKVTVIASASARTLDDEDTELTDIEIAEVAPAAEEPFDVYDLKGHQVLHQVTSLDGLPAGVYIVNGKKVMKK